MNKLKLTLIIQLIFFAGWGIYLLTSVAPNASDIYLETKPVDPRDILSGTYVALSYKISNPTNGDCKTLLKKNKRTRNTIYVKLIKTKTLNLENKKAHIYNAETCSLQYPPKNELWARGIAYPGRSGIRYGIEKFFLNEENPLKRARSGEVLAKVKINKYRKFRLLSLESIIKQ
jgi:uncharacterized membrane-anchored protein